MPAGRSELGVTVLDGLIYAVGGDVDPITSTTLVEVYDPLGDTWDIAASLPITRTRMAIAARDHRLYVFGGSESFSGSPENTSFIYDPLADSWSEITPMPTALFACRAAVVGGMIYVIGGYDGAVISNLNEAFGFHLNMLPLVSK